MASRGDRFRRLRTPQTGDLFEHFGLSTDGPPQAAPERAAVSAAACAHCGWYRPASTPDACPLCGTGPRG